MAKAMMDPEEVRRFAEELKRFNGDLQNRLTSLQARFSSLSETWQDQENDKYSEEFKTTRSVTIAHHGVEIHIKYDDIDDVISQPILDIFRCYKQEIFIIYLVGSIV